MFAKIGTDAITRATRPLSGFLTLLKTIEETFAMLTQADDGEERDETEADARAIDDEPGKLDVR